LDQSRIRWTYTDDKNHDWAVTAQKSITDQGVLGGTAAAVSVPPLPKDWRMRRIYVTAGNVTRSVPSYDTSNAAWTDGTGSINLDLNNVSTAFTVSPNTLEEKQVNRRVCKQST
jgi:hypothetical protein